MGLSIDREHFDEEAYARFSERLRENLAALDALLARPGFGEGPASLGAELELSLVDAAARPLLRNTEVLAETHDPRLTVELDRFNLECNLDPLPLAGRPFAALEADFRGALREVGRAAARHGGRVVAIGILPTLRPEDLQASAMTDAKRYRALSASLQRLRHAPFRVRIDGDDPLDVACEHVTFEGANTSLQVHLRVDPSRFVAAYNAAQLATLPTLAVAANSPTFLGHRLWHETRVALFKHAVDDRGPDRQRSVSRVCFGTGWLRDGPAALFHECVALHEPLLPVCGDEASLARVRAGQVPRLDELRLHQGTVWRWNRGIYDPAHGGHLRIEMRALPSGPTPADMAANAAFLLGLTLALTPDADAWIRGIPFETADHGFYRAAQRGVDAELPWPRGPGEPPETVRADELVQRLLPLARRGLEEGGVAPDDAERALAVIGARAASGRTGSAWQRAALSAGGAPAGDAGDRGPALVAMLERYLALAGTGTPVHAWDWPA